MFRLSQPTAAAVDKSIAAALRLPPFSLHFLALSPGRTPQPLPRGYVRDHSRSLLGSGEAVFSAARAALRTWTHFDLGWVRVANPSAQIAVGQLVAVQVHALGLWSLNVSRILDVLDLPTHFGYIYATTPLHTEDGEEIFLLTLDPATGQVHYTLEAVSRPRNPLARAAYPATRHFQHKFARDSHRRMMAVISVPAANA